MGWLIFAVVVIAGFLFGAAITMIARNYRSDTPQDDANAGTKLRGIYTLFAVLIGFVVFSSWQFYLDASSSVRQEAAAISVLGQGARSLPGNIGQPVLDSLDEYVRAASQDQWYSDNPSAISDAGHVGLQKVHDAITSLPAGESNSISNAQSTMMYYVGEIELARADRVLVSENANPNFTWGLLAVAAIVALGLSSTLHFSSLSTQISLVGGLGAITAAALFTVYALSHPFTGPFPITPEPLVVAEQTLHAK